MRSNLGISWLALLLLFCIAQAAYVPKNNKLYVATYDEIKDKGEATFNKVISTKASMVYLQANGTGEISVSYTQPESNRITIINCRAEEHMYCPIYKQESMANSDPAILNVTIRVSLFEHAGDRTFALSLIEGDYIEFPLSHHGQIALDKFSVVDMVCYLDKQASDVDRVQFVANHNWIDNLEPTESLSIAVKPGSGLIKNDEGVLNGTETIALGIIETIEKGSPGFCPNEGCSYSVRINSTGATGILFRMFLRTPNQEIYIGQSETLIDQLKENSEIKYVIKSYSSTPQEIWNFMLIPIEGNPDIYINEFSNCDVPLSEYRWSSTANTSEAMTIHMKELRSLGINDTSFCVAIKDSHPTTFALQIDNINESMMQIVILNIPYSGELSENQVNRYAFMQVAHFPQTYKMNIDLKAVAGNPDLYIKECRSTGNCDINESDVANRETLANDSSIFFRYSANAADDTIPLEFNCRPPNSQETFDNDYFISESCKFEIAVHSKSLSKYSLIVRGRNHFEMFMLESWNRFLAWQNQIVSYRADVLKILNETKSIEFEFNLISGDAEICLFRTIQQLTSGNCTAKISIDNDNSNLYSKNKKFSYSTQNPADLIGQYFIQINVILI